MKLSKWYTIKQKFCKHKHTHLYKDYDTHIKYIYCIDCGKLLKTIKEE